MTDNQDKGGAAAATTVPVVDYAALMAGSNADVLPVPENNTDDIGGSSDADVMEQLLGGQDDASDAQGQQNVDESASAATKATAKKQEPATTTTVAAGTRDLVAKQLQKDFGGTVKLPDDVTDESALEFYKAQHAPKLHPDVVRFQAAVNAGMKPEDYFKQYSALDDQLAMSDQDLVKMHLKTLNGQSEAKPKGWDDAAIERMVKGMEQGGRLELEALNVRNALERVKADRQKEADQYAAGGRPNMADPKVIAEFEQSVVVSMDNIVKEGDGKLYGLDLSAKGGKEAVTAFLKTYVKVDPKTGLSPFTQELQSNNEFLKVALLYNMAKTGAIKGLVAQTSEKTKAAYLKSLGMEPPKGGGGTGSGNGVGDFSAFMEPSGLTVGKK